MTLVTQAVLLRWEPIRIDLELAEVMGDLDPLWQEWRAPEVAHA